MWNLLKEQELLLLLLQEPQLSQNYSNLGEKKVLSDIKKLLISSINIYYIWGTVNINSFNPFKIHPKS